MRAFRKWPALLAAAALALMAALALFPALADRFLAEVSLPAARALAGFFSSLGFPAAEPLALLLAAYTLSRAAAALSARLRGERLLALRRARALCAVPALLLAAFAALWFPQLVAPSAAPYDAARADRSALSAARAELWAALDAQSAPFDDDLNDILARAAEGVAALDELPARGAPSAPVKAARYPEWMARLNLAGLYCPFTGEAILRADAPKWAVYFTACHEAAHRAGIGGEGQANIAAWNACMALGGGFQASARLWAIRYIDAELADTDGGDYALLAHYVARAP